MPRNFYVKSHGLGNDYIVLDQGNIDFQLIPKTIISLCDVHYGIGSDGILLKTPSNKADFGLKIFNPDGSEAEKSGNGLRIFCKYLFDYHHSSTKTFTVETLGGIVKAEIIESTGGKALRIKIEMGKAEFISKRIPVAIDQYECIGKKIKVLDKDFVINCVSVGNPHCVIFTNNLDEQIVKKYGSVIETLPIFPNKINVQFAKVVSPTEIHIQIWERGAGYTLASGSSSCAVACVARKLGLVQQNTSLVMPGGTLHISVDDNFFIEMTGPVREIVSGIISKEFIEDAH